MTYGLVEGMAIRTFEAYKDGAITIGEMWERALNDYINTISDKEGTDYKTILEWELFGDPTLKIAAESTPPEKPSRPSGPVKPSIKTSNTYTATTTDVDGDEIYYLFEWGDGTFSGWKGPYSSGQEGSASHKYSKEGSFSIRVKAKDEHGVQSPWSDPLPIQSPKNINLPILNRLQQNYPIIYQILQKIFNI